LLFNKAIISILSIQMIGVLVGAAVLGQLGTKQKSLYYFL